jgi:hypothetical protein
MLRTDFIAQLSSSLMTYLGLGRGEWKERRDRETEREREGEGGERRSSSKLSYLFNRRSRRLNMA